MVSWAHCGNEDQQGGQCYSGLKTKCGFEGFSVDFIPVRVIELALKANSKEKFGKYFGLWLYGDKVLKAPERLPQKTAHPNL